MSNKMTGNILRAVYNRPEMLYLSMESEIEARKQLNSDDYVTLFAVEHNPDPKCLELINDFYPFPKEVVVRPFKHMGWGNILEGFKQIFSDPAIAWAMNLEDDCVLHKSAFTYLEAARSLLTDEKVSVINTSKRHAPDGDVNVVRRLNLFEAPACIIMADFFNKFVRQYATYEYYSNRQTSIKRVNDRSIGNHKAKYSYDKGNAFAHVGWDGLVNRLIDVANFEEGYISISPDCDRQIHIGFYGQNRPGRFPSDTDNFEERIKVLREITATAESMQSLDKQYSDYTHFSAALDTWTGHLELV